MMWSRIEELIDHDFGWVGSDQLGQIALFVTAGVGPCPEEVVRLEVENILDLEYRLSQLPLTSGFKYASDDQAGDLSLYIEISKRGLFVFDWSDVHRVRQNLLRGYEKITKPTSPCRLEDLNIDSSQVAKLKVYDFDSVSVVKPELCRQQPMRETP